MKSKLVMFCILLFVLVGFANLKIQAQNYKSAFKYVIFYDHTNPELDAPDETRRNVAVLMDKTKFSKHNLVLLLKLLSKRFPKSDVLSIQVYSDIKDVETPEEQEAGKFSGVDEPYGITYPHAVLTQFNKRTRILFYPNDKDVEEFEVD